MKFVFSGIAAASAVLALSVAPVRAKPSEEQIAGAIALLGIAALAHHEGHYRGGWSPTSEAETADFERGYRDGLHNERYDTRWDTRAYSEGYDAGQKERSHRLSHSGNRSRGDHVDAPTLAVRGCVGEASAQWGRDPRDIHATRSRQMGSNDFYIEVGAGHHHGVCEVGATGNIYQFQNGRLK
ncbi:hypothetical protein [Ostreiculturibacter nitratireducens]|uniref:hypothetical protein n=1 Tax=Ostreiculturibacter nitratireducens TaxID=3075226 RepID=UPI0031B5CB2A